MNQPTSSNSQSRDYDSNAAMADVWDTDVDEADEVRRDVDWGLAIFLYETLIANREPLTELSEAELLQALEKYGAAHPPNQISSGTEEHPEPLQLPDDPVDEEYFTVHMSNEARSCTGDQPETSQDDPAEISVQNNTQQCHWIDETTHRKCLEFVPEGLQPMLSHLNTVHNVRGSEKDQKGCMWAVIHSGHESACGGISQRRNMPRHIAKHLGLRCTCKLCGKDFARSDLLKGHERKDHQVQDTSASYA